jgi:hypothetical protein
MQWHGTKLPNPLIEEQVNGGPDDYTIPLSFTGFDNGKVKYTIIVNGTNVATGTIIIGSPGSQNGGLMVRSTPSDAQIYLDGVYYGTTPAVIGNVPPGVRTVTLKKEGYGDYTTKVTVFPNRIASVSANLHGGVTPGQTGSAYIRSSPSGATITIDGNYYGVTPRIVSGLPEGTRILTLSKSGYADYTTPITVKARGMTAVFARLTSSTSGAALSDKNIDVYTFGRSGDNAIGRINPADLAGLNGPVVSNRLASILAGQAP